MSNRSAKDRSETIEVARRNWQAEVETAQTYRDLADRERDEKRKGILLRMAEAEERHAQRWEKTLRDLGAEPPVYKDTVARRLNRWWNKIAGAEVAIRRMEATEERQEAEFHEHARRWTQSSSAIAGMGEAAVGSQMRSMARTTGWARCLESFRGSPAPQITSSISF